ncbi:MAG: hypothetical protein LQ338_000531 [Usnochroma carphineum]|nr:MAG: hypothetical protein LQ338_000531 [Usnochroma carphineum]
MSLPQPILISGAGIGGLALAQGLQKAKIPFRVFERDHAYNLRPQGYRFRLPEAGIIALKQLLSPDLFARVVATCGKIDPEKPWANAHLDALSGEAIVFGPGGPAQGPPGANNAEQLVVDRTVLRAQLIRGLESYIEYGREASSYEVTPRGVIVRFADGGEAEGSFFVGADGSRSRVRKQLAPQLDVVDTEGRLIYGKTVLTPKFEERFPKSALVGATMIQDRSHESPISLLLEPVRFKDNEFRSELPEDYVYWVMGLRKDSPHITDDATMHNLTAEQSAALAKRITQKWHPSFQALFDLQAVPHTYLIRAGTVRPEIPAWNPIERVTLIGDAAHLMSPTAGAGTTSAFRDAANLVQMLRDDGISVDGIRERETVMREFAGEAIKRSIWGGKLIFGQRPFEELNTVVG